MKCKLTVYAAGLLDRVEVRIFERKKFVDRFLDYWGSSCSVSHNSSIGSFSFVLSVDCGRSNFPQLRSIERLLFSAVDINIIIDGCQCIFQSRDLCDCHMLLIFFWSFILKCFLFLLIFASYL